MTNGYTRSTKITIVPIGIFDRIVPIGIIKSIAYLALETWKLLMSGGRKIAFDKQHALAAAMHVFWKKGFSGASLADLTTAMGINKPSLYAAFGNKESLFIQATDYYVEHIGGAHSQPLNQTGVPLRERLQTFLMSVLAGQCDEHTPKGCYISLCAAETEADAIPEAARQKIQEVSQLTYNMLRTLFTQDPEAKQLKLDINAADNANFLVTVLHGSASMARTGHKYDALTPIVMHALKGLGI